MCWLVLTRLHCLILSFVRAYKEKKTHKTSFSDNFFKIITKITATDQQIQICFLFHSLPLKGKTSFWSLADGNNEVQIAGITEIRATVVSAIQVGPRHIFLLQNTNITNWKRCKKISPASKPTNQPQTIYSLKMRCLHHRCSYIQVTAGRQLIAQPVLMKCGFINLDPVHLRRSRGKHRWRSQGSSEWWHQIFGQERWELLLHTNAQETYNSKEAGVSVSMTTLKIHYSYVNQTEFRL